MDKDETLKIRINGKTLAWWKQMAAWRKMTLSEMIREAVTERCQAEVAKAKKRR